MERQALQSSVTEIERRPAGVAARADRSGVRAPAGRPAGSVLETWGFVALSTLVLVGAYNDGWAHNRELTESFFTIYHAILYAGLNLVTLYVVGLMYRNHRRGYPWARALPRGYEVTLLGLAVFTVGGAGDMIWHVTFGIEEAAESLVSPMHIVLTTGGGLIIAGALAWAYRRAAAPETTDPATRYLLPVLIAFILSVTTFITQFYHPFGRTSAAVDYTRRAAELRIDWFQPPKPLPLHVDYTRRAAELRIEEAPFTLDVASVLLQSAVLMGLVLLFMRHRPLPPGSITIILAINTALVTYMKADRLATGPVPLFIAAVVAGLFADALLWRLQPSAARRPVAFRAFAFAVPFILYICYFLTLELAGGGIAWVIHLWAGSIVLAGITGWLVSYLVLPPRSLELEPAGEPARG